MPGTIPLWIKLTYTLYVGIVIVRYWRVYGPTNFLYFCDAALLMAVPALWLENALLASAAAVGILVPQTLWFVDFLCELCGFPLTGMTAYMFKPTITLFTRLLSSFHMWLPFFLLWLVAHLGYDPRALAVWTLLGWTLMVVCYFVVPAPPAASSQPNRPVNVNYVFGLNDERPQRLMPGWLYFVLLLIFMPVCIYWPTHMLLSYLFPEAPPTASGRFY